MKWRVTFVESGYSSITSMCNFAEGRAIAGIPSITSSPRMEIRGSNGAIIRIGAGSEFTLIDFPLGEQPQFYGEIFVSRENPAKYRTSCWLARSPSSATIDYFVKPIAGRNADEYFSILGELVIFEFNENGKPYDIVSISEGNSVVVSYAVNSDGLHSYSAQPSKKISEADY